MNLRIYKEEALVGELFTSDKGICFQYSEGYLNSEAYPLSLSLPLQTEAHPQKVALPFFEGLLPEGNQRQELSNILQVSPTSTMKLLRALAGECVGNLIILDEDMQITSALSEASYSPLSNDELEALLRPRSIERARFMVRRRLSLAGAQAKLGLFWEDGTWYATNGLAPTSHIIKPASEFDPTLLINEYVMMQLASSCGIDTPRTSMIRSGAHYGFVVERFDRLRVDTRIKRIGQEDFCQALSVMPVSKYENDGGPGFRELFNTTLLHTSRPVLETQKLLRLVLFNYLTGNCDAHAKNFSLLQNPENGMLSLAPAYDLICTTFYGERLESSMAMRIGEHSRIDRITKDDFALFSEEAGINFKAIARELHLLRESITGQIDEITQRIAQETPDFLPDARNLREHILSELDTRLAL